MVHPQFAAGVLALTPFLFASAPAQEVPPAPAPPAQTPPAATALDEDLDRAVVDLRKKVWLKTASHDDFLAVRGLLDARQQARPEVDVVLHAQTARLERALDQLELRSSGEKLDVAHIDMFREELVDSRLDAALDRLQEVRDDGQQQTARLQLFDQLLRTRAEVGLTFDPRSGEFPRVLEKLLMPLRDKARDGKLAPEDLQPLRQLLAETRIDHGITVLEKRFEAGDLAPDSVDRLRGVAQDEELRAKEEDRAAVHATYEPLVTALDELERHQRAGQPSAADFQALRGAVARRPLEASAGRERKKE